MDFSGRTKSICLDTEHLFDETQDLPFRIGHPNTSISTDVVRQGAWDGPSTAGPARHVPLEARTMNLLSVLNPISSEAFDELKRNHNLDIVAEAEGQDLQSHKTRKKHRTHGKRHNKAYTPEQVHYIMYHREDLELPWMEVRNKYRERYNVKDCFEGALQSRHYRAQLVPFLDIMANPVLDENGTVIMRKMTVRERSHKIWSVPVLDGKKRPVKDERGKVLMRELTKVERNGPVGKKLQDTLAKYIKLGDRLPGLLCKYKDWVKFEHQEEGEKREKYRLDHGIVLPGATHCGGDFIETVLAVNAAGAVLKEEFRNACCTTASW